LPSDWDNFRPLPAGGLWRHRVRVGRLIFSCGVLAFNRAARRIGDSVHDT